MSIFDEWKHAVMQGDSAIVKSLLADNPELRSRINEPVFPFDSSAAFHSRGNLDVLDALLEHGADLNRKTQWWAGGFGILEGVRPEVARPLIERGATVDIWAAVSLDDADETKRLLARDPQLIHARGGDGKQPLHDAQSVPMVDLLCSSGADPNARDVDHTSTPAQYLVRNQPVVLRLLELGAEPDIFLAAALGRVSLIDACLESHPECANERLGVGTWRNDAGGVIYNWTLGHDATPQDVARERGHVEALQRLLAASSPQRQLTDAIWCDDRDRIRALLGADPDIVRSLALDDRQLLARAAWSYRPEAVRTMLTLGFDPHVAGVHDSTPLDRAAFHGYSDIVEILLTHDPNPPCDRKNEFGGTPLETCIHGFRHGWKTGHPQDHHATVKLVLEAGATRSADRGSVGDPRMDQLLKAAGPDTSRTTE